MFIKVVGNVPRYAHSYDAGADITSPISTVIYPHSCVTIPTGVRMAIPRGHMGRIEPRSSLFKKGLLTNGTIDNGYTGEIGVTLWNISDQAIAIDKGDRIAQLIIVPIVNAEFFVADSLEKTERGDGGFGSTGR